MSRSTRTSCWSSRWTWGEAYFRRVEVDEDAVDRHVPIDVRMGRPSRGSSAAASATAPTPACAVAAASSGAGSTAAAIRPTPTSCSPRSSAASRPTTVCRRRIRAPTSSASPPATPTEDTDTARSQTGLLSGTFSRNLGTWRESFTLGFRREDFEVGVDSGVTDPRSRGRVRQDQVGRPHLPDLGTTARLRGPRRGGRFLTDTSFVQLTGRAKAIWSFGRTRLISRADLGWTETSDFRSLPASLRFFAGGDQSVRGYDYQELGPLDEEDNVIGGEALVVGSVELDRLFFDFGRFGQWGAAVFYDVGGAAHDLGKSLESGVGAGLRWLSPIGLVRVDAAVALDRPGSPIRSTSTLGPTSDDPMHASRRDRCGARRAGLARARGGRGGLAVRDPVRRALRARARGRADARQSRARRVDGPIRGPLRLERVVYEREGLRLEINELLLRWRPRALLRRQLDVEELAASGVRLRTEPTLRRDPLELPQIDLPVNLAVRQATVRGAAIAIGGGEPIRIRSAALETVSRGDALVIERFDLDSPDLELEVSGSLTPLGAYPVDLDLAWALALPDGTRYRGAGTLDGTLEDLTVRQRLTEPFAAVVEAGCSIRSMICDSRAAPKPPAFRSPRSIPLARDAGVRRRRGVGSARRSRGEGPGEDRERRLRDGGRRRRDRGRRQELAHRAPAPGSDRSRAKVSATAVELDDPPRFDLEAGWTDLRWPLDPPRQAMLLAPSGSLRASGTTASYRIEGGLRAALPAVTLPRPGRRLSIDAQLAVAGDASGARIERLDGRTLGGRVTGEGALSWSPRSIGDWPARRRSAPRSGRPRLDGDLDLAVSTEGRMTEAGPRGSIALRRIAGRVHGQPVRGDGRVELRGEQLSIPDLRLVWGDAALAAAGVVGDTLDLRFRLDAPDLAKLLPDVAGSLSIDGALDGPRTSPGLEAKLQAVSLAIGTLRAKSIAGTVTAGAGERDPLDVALTVSDLAYGERDFPVAR